MLLATHGVSRGFCFLGNSTILQRTQNRGGSRWWGCILYHEEHEGTRRKSALSMTRSWSVSAAREVPRPAGESAGLRNDRAVRVRGRKSRFLAHLRRCASPDGSE